MSNKRNPPFRAEHCGSLLRPDALLKMRYAGAEGTSSAADLASLEDKYIADIVNTQLECGFHAVGDGEYRRHQFWGTFFETLNGMKEMQTAAMKGYDKSLFRLYAPDIKSFFEDKVVPNQVTICVDKISHTGHSVYLHEYEYVKTLLPEDQWGNIKLTLPSPSWYHFRYAPGRAFPQNVYKTDEEYFADVAKAYQTELDILYKAGVRNIQIDDPNLACKVPLLFSSCSSFPILYKTFALIPCWKDGRQTKVIQRLQPKCLMPTANSIALAFSVQMICIWVFIYAVAITWEVVISLKVPMTR